MILTAASMILAAALWSASLVRRYRATGDAGHMRRAGTVIMTGSFIAAIITVYESPIYPDRLLWALGIATAGAAAGAVFSSFAFKGWGKLSALWRGLVFFGFSVFMVLSIPGHAFHRPIRMGHALRECSKVVPGSSREEIARLDRAGREALAARLGEALTSPDEFVRLGSLLKLSYMPEEAGPAVPAMTPLIAAMDENDEVSRELVKLLAAMGPAAAAAVPAMEAKIAELGPYRNFALENALEAVRPPGQTTAP